MADKVRLSALIAPPFHAAHRALREDRFAEYWLKGGRGSGKSSFIALEIILQLMRDPRANAVVYRKVAATLRESVYEQLLWAVDALGLERFFRPRLAPLEILFLVLLFVLSTAALVNQSYNPFIYFRF